MSKQRWNIEHPAVSTSIVVEKCLKSWDKKKYRMLNESHKRRNELILRSSKIKILLSKLEKMYHFLYYYGFESVYEVKSFLSPENAKELSYSPNFYQCILKKEDREDKIADLDPQFFSKELTFFQSNNSYHILLRSTIDQVQIASLLDWSDIKKSFSKNLLLESPHLRIQSLALIANISTNKDSHQILLRENVLETILFPILTCSILYLKNTTPNKKTNPTSQKPHPLTWSNNVWSYRSRIRMPKTRGYDKRRKRIHKRNTLKHNQEKKVKNSFKVDTDEWVKDAKIIMMHCMRALCELSENCDALHLMFKMKIYNNLISLLQNETVLYVLKNNLYDERIMVDTSVVLANILCKKHVLISSEEFCKEFVLLCDSYKTLGYDVKCNLSKIFEYVPVDQFDEESIHIVEKFMKNTEDLHHYERIRFTEKYFNPCVSFLKEHPKVRMEY
ncbi:hypothetical protein AKO1_011477 [Acrasis kona]|uniref:Uncharacterized protein n=1 Tax=Acrasis kona TaxID=1008807 RepID=A0AAW2Z1C0_9EUKA